MGYPIFINPCRVSSPDELAPCIQASRQARKEAGHPENSEVGLRIPIYVADTARRTCGEPGVVPKLR